MNYTFLGYHVESSSNPLPTFRATLLDPSSRVKNPSKIGTRGRCLTRNNPEARRAHFLRGRSPKSRMFHYWLRDGHLTRQGFLRDLLNHWTYLIKINIFFGELMIRYWWQSTLFFLLPSQKIFLTDNSEVKNWHCCPKGRKRKVHIFYVLPLASAWGRTANFNVLFVYTLLMIRYLRKKLPSIRR